MVSLNMEEEEGKFLLNVLERYAMHLDVEIVRTDRREFKDALKKRAEMLASLIDRLKKESVMVNAA